MPDLDARSDKELVAAINNGDAAAFESLYRRHRDWTVRLAYRFTGNKDDALDVLQETFGYLVRKFPGFELTASITSFLYPVVKHNALALVRTKRPDLAADDLLDRLPSPEQSGPGQRADLATVLSALPANQREVVLMRYVDGMSTQEVAAALDIPPGTVKSRLHKALQTLREDPRTRAYFLT